MGGGGGGGGGGKADVIGPCDVTAPDAAAAWPRVGENDVVEELRRADDGERRGLLASATWCLGDCAWLGEGAARA